MAASTYSVTLHHLAPGAQAAGVGYPDEQLNGVTTEQLTELLQALAQVAASLTIYEPSTPEIRIKTDREIYVVRTRYRRLCFVGREALLRGEEHTIPYIIGTISGLAEPELKAATPRAPERPASASPTPAAGGSRAPTSAPPWTKIAVLAALSLACFAGGVWLLVKPARGVAPKFTKMDAAASAALLSRIAGEYQTGTREGDRRLIISADGTLRLAKYGPNKTIAEEIIRTARGALQDGKPALATADPYVMQLNEPDSIVLYGQIYKRVVQ
jgi:hypothetical protein